MVNQKYCLIIDRKTELGLNIMGYPSDNFEYLIDIANAAAEILYVSRVSIC